EPRFKGGRGGNRTSVEKKKTGTQRPQRAQRNAEKTRSRARGGANQPRRREQRRRITRTQKPRSSSAAARWPRTLFSNPVFPPLRPSASSAASAFLPLSSSLPRSVF